MKTMEKDMLLQMNKKGISIMVGYILLISLAVIMGGVMYAWMKSYVPSEEIACPDGVAMVVENYNYTCATGILNLSLKNNGRFDIAGYYIKATDDEDQTLASKDISKKVLEFEGIINYGSSVLIGSINENSFSPGEEVSHIFDLSTVGRVYSVEIIPTRWQTEKNKLRFIGCGETSKFKQKLECSD